ncbi:hypothetical protein C8F04DRAFT_1179519 [Mycena alexandri]|uniref:Uncharacterized protein n=1 Tax=Mycena alexandri TaxID=1745969 RepID=A0AAD6T4V3_9AGAR|nr:hypothetical protein C8F04DRAFT_1179519 [Mycena alexandri]
MAVSTKSTRRTLPFARSTLLRPIRAARLAHCDALDQWIGRADLSTASKVSLHGPLPAGQVMCRIFVVCLERPLSPVYLLSMRAYEPRAGPTGTIRLAHFTGFPGDADAPLWVRRLPPGKYLTFPQPRAFVANLVGGVSDIPVQSLIYDEITNEMRTWASITAIGTPARRALARHCMAMGKVWARGNFVYPVEFEFKELRFISSSSSRWYQKGHFRSYGQALRSARKDQEPKRCRTAQLDARKRPLTSKNESWGSNASAFWQPHIQMLVLLQDRLFKFVVPKDDETLFSVDNRHLEKQAYINRQAATGRPSQLLWGIVAGFSWCARPRSPSIFEIAQRETEMKKVKSQITLQIEETVNSRMSSQLDQLREVSHNNITLEMARSSQLKAELQMQSAELVAARTHLQHLEAQALANQSVLIGQQAAFRRILATSCEGFNQSPMEMERVQILEALGLAVGQLSCNVRNLQLRFRSPRVIRSPKSEGGDE